MDTSEREAYQAFLRQRRTALLERIEAAAKRSGRSSEDITLLAVSKTVGNDEVLMAHSVGYRAFGENRPQELKKKVAAVQASPEMAGVRFDMIGNLQKNKINQVLGNAHLIHSVSSWHLAEAIATRSEARGCRTACLMEVNVSGEASKSGFSPEEAVRILPQIMELASIRIEGLMTMAPARDASAARQTFSGLRELAEDLRVRSGLPLETLSCGMSDDFEIAVEEGSTLVRLGRIVFDPAYKDVLK